MVNPSMILTRDEVRQIDAAAVKELEITGLMLMENAARGVADVIHQEFPDKFPLIVCGPGNNGGDGLALARQLAACDRPSRVLLLRAGRNLTDDTAANLKILTRSGSDVCECSSVSELENILRQQTDPCLIVDCLLGTGVRGVVREPHQSVIAAINDAGKHHSILSVDVPSGFDCEIGKPDGECICADHTVTFVGRKTGFGHPETDQYTGTITVAHIGLPQAWVRSWLAGFRQQRDSR